MQHSFPTRSSSDLKPYQAETISRHNEPTVQYRFKDKRIYQSELWRLAAITRGMVSKRPRAVWHVCAYCNVHPLWRSEEHTSELQSLMRISYAVFFLKKKPATKTNRYR